MTDRVPLANPVMSMRTSALIFWREYLYGKLFWGKNPPFISPKREQKLNYDPIGYFFFLALGFALGLALAFGAAFFLAAFFGIFYSFLNLIFELISCEINHVLHNL